jgi:hypothetical protein
MKLRSDRIDTGLPDSALDEVKLSVAAAVDCYSHVIEHLDEDHLESRYHLATILHKTFSLNESLKHYTKVSELKPNDHTVFHAMATVCYDLNQYDLCT